jgi:DNA-binding transcriptional LysR family regulator
VGGVIGKILAAMIVIAAIAAGIGVWYTQNYAYYRELDPKDPAALVRLLPLSGGAPEDLIATEVKAIDSDSSPIRFRGCYQIETSIATLTETYQTFAKPVPLNAPGWFDCYDAVEIGEALEKGEAVAFLAQPLVHPDVDRVVAVFPDGRAFAWHQLRPED